MNFSEDEMPVETKSFTVSTQGNCDILDITPQVSRELSGADLSSGTATVFVAGSTCAVTTIEYESGVLSDLKDAFERMAPEAMRYAHNARWGDGNGHSHVRASVLGPSLTVPFSEDGPLLGTWQQIVLVDFDNRPRTRKVIVQIIGE